MTSSANQTIAGQLPMPAYNLPAGALVRIDGVDYQPQQQIVPGRFIAVHATTRQPYVCPDEAGVVGLPTDHMIDQLRIDGRFEIILPERRAEARRLAAESHWDAQEIDEMDPEARLRAVTCRLLDEHGIKNGVKAIEAGLEKHWSPELIEKHGPMPVASTVKRWRTDRGAPGMRTLKDMLDMSGRVPARPYVPDVVHELKMKHALRYFVDRRIIKSHYDECMTELALVNTGQSADYPAPTNPYEKFSYDTFRRAVIKLEGDATSTARHGLVHTKATRRGAGEPLTAGRALEKVIIDHTRLDVFVIDPEREMVLGRPWLTLAVDVYSRPVLGWVLTFLPPSYWSVSEVILRSNLPKRPPARDLERYPGLARLCGSAALYIVDNAPEFRCSSFEDASKSGGFAVRFCPIKEPPYRAIGERAIGTVKRRIADDFEGRALPIAYTRIADYDGEANAVATLAELEGTVNKSFAEYHTEPHDGLNNRQPLLMFQKSAAKHGIDIMHDMASFRLETMQVEQDVQVTKSGVRLFNGLRYHDRLLVPLLIDDNLRFEPRRPNRQNATVHTKVKFDPNDISRIHVWSKAETRYYPLKCSDAVYADGMPLWFHEQIREAAKAEAEAFNTEDERMEARARRVAAIRAISPQAKAIEREKLARLYEIPRIRQVTGNLVSLDYEFPEPVTTDDFIAHDVASLTALDNEILAPRAPIGRARKSKIHRDRRDAGSAKSVDDTVEQKAPARRSSRLAGKDGA